MSSTSDALLYTACKSMQLSKLYEVCLSIYEQEDYTNNTAPRNASSCTTSNTQSCSRLEDESFLTMILHRYLDSSSNLCQGTSIITVLTLIAVVITLATLRGSACVHFRRILLLGDVSPLTALQKMRSGVTFCTDAPQQRKEDSSQWWRQETTPLTPRPRSIGQPAAMSLSPRLQQQYEQKQSPLFSRLPPEIRNRIYEMAVGNKLVHLEVIVPWHHDSSFGSRPRMQHYLCRRGSDPNTWNHSCWHPNFLSSTCHMDPAEGLLKPLLVCRRMYNEAIPFLYANNTFHANNLDFFVFADELLLPKRLAQIRSLKVELDLSNKRQRCHTPPRELENVIEGEYTALWDTLRQMKDLKDFKLFVQIDPMSAAEWHSIKHGILGDARRLTVESFDVFICGGPFAIEGFEDPWLEECQKQMRHCRIQTSWPEDQRRKITDEKGGLT